MPRLPPPALKDLRDQRGQLAAQAQREVQAHREPPAHQASPAQPVAVLAHQEILEIKAIPEIPVTRALSRLETKGPSAHRAQRRPSVVLLARLALWDLRLVLTPSSALMAPRARPEIPALKLRSGLRGHPV